MYTGDCTMKLVITDFPSVWIFDDIKVIKYQRNEWNKNPDFTKIQGITKTAVTYFSPSESKTGKESPFTKSQ